jgi:MFS family permease
VLFSFSRYFWLSAALLLPVGFCMMLQMSSSNTLIQAMVPDHLRGRVMAMSMMFMGMAPRHCCWRGGGTSGSDVYSVGCGGLHRCGRSFFFHLPKIRVESHR